MTANPSDFADWFSPMLVKELRQGMRSRIFMAAFYLTQLLMILCVIFNLVAASNSEMDHGVVDFLSGLFWFMISVPLLFVMPLRGFGSLHGEMKSGTLELVFHTRLSAWRIAAGKWTALMVQTLLLVCAILPYVLLRYFLGGVDIIQDVQSLFFLLMASAALTGITIAMSPYESKLLRALFIFGLIFGFQFLIGLILAWVAGAAITGGGSSLAPWQFYAGLVVFLPAFLLLALEIAASRIAPPSENHAIRKRLIGLFFLLAAPLFLLIGADARTTYAFVLFFLAVVVIDALAEPQVLAKSVYQPFLRRGAVGFALSRVFTPGWASASWYVALVAVIGGGLLAVQGQFDDPNHRLGYVAALGAIIFPAAIIRLFIPATKHFLGFYIALQFFLAALTMLVGMMSGISEQPLAIWLCPFPNSVFLFNLVNEIKPGQTPGFLVLTALVTAGSLALLLARTITPLRDIRTALALPSPPDA